MNATTSIGQSHPKATSDTGTALDQSTVTPGSNLTGGEHEDDPEPLPVPGEMPDHPEEGPGKTLIQRGSSLKV